MPLKWEQRIQMFLKDEACVFTSKRIIFQNANGDRGEEEEVGEEEMEEYNWEPWCSYIV